MSRVDNVVLQKGECGLDSVGVNIAVNVDAILVSDCLILCENRCCGKVATELVSRAESDREHRGL